MGLADELLKVKDQLRSTSTARCSVGVLLGLLGEEDRQALVSFMENGNYQGTMLTKFIRNYGETLLEEVKNEKDPERERHLELVAERCCKMGADAIQRHRRGACLCGRRSA